MPDAVVARAGLAAGLALDRPTLRRVRTELRRAQASAVAGRALARRDLTEHELETRLERAGLGPAEIEKTKAAAVSAGVVDDERFARARAAQLAGRGYGNAYVLAKLRAAGVADELAREVVEDLPSEAGRAEAVRRSGRELRARPRPTSHGAGLPTTRSKRPWSPLRISNRDPVGCRHNEPKQPASKRLFIGTTTLLDSRTTTLLTSI